MKANRHLLAQRGGYQNLLYKSPILLLFLLSLIVGCALPFGGNLTPEEQVAVVTTDRGIFVIEFYPDAAPGSSRQFH